MNLSVLYISLVLIRLIQKSIVLPDQRLKELTVLATYEVAKAIAKQQPETEHKIQGRLLKAR